MHIQAPPVSSAQMQSNTFHSSALTTRGVVTTSSIISRLSRQRLLRLIARASTALSRAKCAINTWCYLPTFKYTRSFFDASLAAVPFTPDPFKIPGTSVGFSPNSISVPITNPFNPFTVADATLLINGVPVPVTTGVKFRGINDTGPRHEHFTYQDSLFDVGMRGEMGEIGDYFKTWNWETGFRYARNEGKDISIGEVSQPGLRDALLDTDPATAFDPFLNFTAHNTRAARSRVYVTLHNSGQDEQIGRAHV